MSNNSERAAIIQRLSKEFKERLEQELEPTLKAGDLLQAEVNIVLHYSRLPPVGAEFHTEVKDERPGVLKRYVYRTKERPWAIRPATVDEIAQALELLSDVGSRWANFLTNFLQSENKPSEIDYLEQVGLNGDLRKLGLPLALRVIHQHGPGQIMLLAPPAPQ